MDIFSHAFWNIAVSKAASSKSEYLKKKKNRINSILLAIWSIAPDFFAFAPVFIFYIILFLSGDGIDEISKIPHSPSEVEPLTGNGVLIFKLTRTLYNLSHSVVIFFLVILITFLIIKKIRIEMFGWLLHIIIDIPTHSYKFYPTPVFWPIAKWKFDGLSWGTPWFMTINISLIGFVLLFYFLHNHRKNKKL